MFAGAFWSRGSKVADAFEEIKQKMQDALHDAGQKVPAIESAEDKYVYFLLGIAAAAIAYGMQRTSTASLHPADSMLGLAFVCWGVSFWAGCWNRDRRLQGDVIRLSSDVLRVAVEAQRMITPPSEDLGKAAR